MLPGGGTSKAIDVDNVPPFDGAYYDVFTTWSLVPLQPNGPQKGRIRNSLLAQTITLWFNIRNNTNLGGISLVDDTLVTRKTESCGTLTPVGESTRFGLPHNVIVYLNGGNGYPATINGLFSLANDVLGGVVTNISASSVNDAVDIINNAFDECRILTGTIPYNNNLLTKTAQLLVNAEDPNWKPIASNTLKVVAYPNPYKDHFQLFVTSPVTGNAKIEFFSINGQKIHEMYKGVRANSGIMIPYNGPVLNSTIFYKVSLDKHLATGIVLRPN
jgi:hypothetical protein